MAKKDKALKISKKERVRADGIPVVIFKNGRKRFIKTTINMINGGKAK